MNMKMVDFNEGDYHGDIFLFEQAMMALVSLVKTRNARAAAGRWKSEAIS